MSIPIYFLDVYGLTVKDLKNVDNKITLFVTFAEPPLKKMLPLSVLERKKFAHKYYNALYQKLVSNFPLVEARHGEDGWPLNLRKATIVVSGQTLYQILNQATGVESLAVQRIIGMKPIKTKQIFPTSWFYFIALFEERVRGKNKGVHMRQEKVLLVFAHSYNEAERRAKKTVRKMEKVYFDQRYQLVKHTFVEFLESRYAGTDNEIINKSESNIILSRIVEPGKITAQNAWL